jgi:hypothetical protein
MRDLWELYYERLVDSTDDELGTYIRKHLTDEALELLYSTLADRMAEDKLNDVDGDDDDR